jgi:flagellar assembly protein FliH
MSTSDWKPAGDGTDAPQQFVPLDPGSSSGEPAEFEACRDGAVPVPLKDVPGGKGSPRQQADLVMEEARRKAEHLEREAFEKGFAQGEKAGLEMMQNSLETTSGALAAAATLVEQNLAQRAAEMEEEVVHLALAVARKVVQREVAADPGLVKDVVRAALEAAQLRGDVNVRVNPLDRETLLEVCPEVAKSLEAVRTLTVDADETVARGGALVECAMGELDLRLGRQLDEIERAFAKLFSEGQRDDDPAPE